ncbi:dihydrodipicolinate synthase family protein [Salmonella enterica subsp. enterica serovar Newport]|nr:dihydrodipicolinate synthase family protein [Salmonella enterica subsp. enterica serovar Newport]
MFKGAATPVMTPLNAQQEIDYNATEKVIEFLIGHKMDALLFLGSCGEFFAFSDEEKRDYIRFVCHRVQGRVPVLIGTGGTDLRQVTALTRYAQECEADAAVIVSPYYFSFDEETVTEFYRTILRNVTLPVIAYNFPERTGYSLTPGQLAILATEFPHFIGVKDTVDNISHTRAIIQTVKPVRPDFRVYSGYDEYFLSNLLAGGDGVIGGISNFFPDLFRRLYDGYCTGDFRTVSQNSALISEAMQVYQLGNPFITAMKTAMQAAGLPVLPVARAPVLPAKASQLQAVQDLINHLQRKISDEHYQCGQ